ncbi:MAG: Hpt domain-containing protein [Chlorobium phaeobacteroides]|uniref:Hpt protein n=1 Tax=Chlorobium phaeobacteroides (strain BS1) TaxID=331678 RepID=B3ELB5_CHLPB|nr:Hpt domain-containing protein [Chlorobium phaeobacteroides]MBL6956979.1 Hpt domain-containing protein [Chlorobium phaeobacteroides]NEX13723.1 Hpt domain-containing protein [Prosthecochloris sp.]
MKNWLKKDAAEEKDSQCGNASEEPLPIINYPEFLDRVMGETELALSILEEFAGLVGQHGEKLRQAVESGDHESVRQIGHLIKGESANISATALYQSSLAIEQAGKSGNSAEQRKILPGIIEDIAGLTKAIRHLLQNRET